MKIIKALMVIVCFSFLQTMVYSQDMVAEVVYQVRRQYSNAFDADQVFTNQLEFNAYITNNPTRAYPGQIVSLVIDGTSTVYKIDGTNGNLSTSNIQFWTPNDTSSTNWTWTSDGREITITGWLGGSTDVVIPDILDGLPVTTIGENAFYGNSDITSVKSGQFLTTLLNSSFMMSTNLGSVDFSNVKYVVASSFLECSALTNISLPKMISAGADAFASLSSLTSIDLYSITYMDTISFNNCTNLLAVNFYGNAPTAGADVYSGSPNVTNYVFNPTAAGWGTTFGGQPVVRIPLESQGVNLLGGWIYLNGSETNNGSWRIGYTTLTTNVVVQVRVEGTWTNVVQFLKP